MDMNKAITKNSDDRKKDPKEFEVINPHIQVGSYFWGLLGNYVANHVKNFFKEQQKAEI